MSAGDAPRVGPGTWRDVGPVVASFARLAGRVRGTPPPAVFLTLGRHRRLFWGWLHLAGRLVPGGRLARREAELVAQQDLSDALWTELAPAATLTRRRGPVGAPP